MGTWQQRLRIATLFALVGFTVSAIALNLRGCGACDFDVSWRAAKHLLAGENPYAEIQPIGAYPANTTFYYPLPAALVALPFVPLSPALAAASFFGLGTGLMTYALSRDGWGGLAPLLSAPFWIAATLAQWSPWILAAALLPALGWAASAKPNLGAGALAYRFNRVSIYTAALVLIISLIILPEWPLGWLRALQTNIKHMPPILIPPVGLLLTLSLFAWKSPGGRLLLLLSIVPQTLWFYDQLLLLLVPSRVQSRWLLAAASWAAYGIWRLNTYRLGIPAIELRPDRYVVALLYIPTLAILLWEEVQLRRHSSDAKTTSSTQDLSQN